MHSYCYYCSCCCNNTITITITNFNNLHYFQGSRSQSTATYIFILTLMPGLLSLNREYRRRGSGRQYLCRVEFLSIIISLVKRWFVTWALNVILTTFPYENNCVTKFLAAFVCYFITSPQEKKMWIIMKKRRQKRHHNLTQTKTK